MVEISTDKMAKYINKLIKINDELTSRTRHDGHNDNDADQREVGVDDDGKYLSLQKLGFILKKFGVDDDD